MSHLADDLCPHCFAYVMGELNAIQARRFQRHLRVCARCQAECAELSSLRHYAEQPPARTSATSHVLNVQSFGRRMHGFAAGMVVCVCMLSLLIVHHHEVVGHLHETALDVDTGIRESYMDIEWVAHRFVSQGYHATPVHVGIHGII